MGSKAQHLEALERGDSIGWLLLLSLQEPDPPEELLNLTSFIILLESCKISSLKQHFGMLFPFLLYRSRKPHHEAGHEQLCHLP